MAGFCPGQAPVLEQDHVAAQQPFGRAVLPGSAGGLDLVGDVSITFPDIGGRDRAEVRDTPLEFLAPSRANRHGELRDAQSRKAFWQVGWSAPLPNMIRWAASTSLPKLISSGY